MNAATLRWMVVAGLLVAVAPRHARAQNPVGSIDTRDAVERQIRALELSIDPDGGAEKESVILRWLADLYTSAGRLDDAEQAYTRILFYYDHDVGTCTAYARFLISQRNAPARADSVLARLFEWANRLDAPPPHLGEAHAMRALALHDLHRCADALAECQAAVSLLDAVATEDALRIKAACLVEEGRREEAGDAYLDLIGLSGGSQPEDINAYITFMAASAGHVDAAVIESHVARAIDEARDTRRKAARGEGARMVEIESDDRARLEGTLHPGESGNGVLMVPDFDERRSNYTPYAQLLSLDGMVALTVDLRGQGDSRCDSLPGYTAMSQDNRERLPDDVAAAYRFLRSETGLADDRLAIVASGRACGIVERSLHEHGLSPAVVYLSPVFDATDRDLASAISFRPQRPTLLVAGKEDLYALQSLGLFVESARTAPTTLVYDSAGHAAAILHDPGRFADVDSWLRRALEPSR